MVPGCAVPDYAMSFCAVAFGVFLLAAGYRMVRGV